jgi:3-oxoacyl-[acyl-carrier protein] reductase
MSKNLEGKVAVVAGSGQGIGRAIAIRLAKEGAKVVTNNRCKGSTGFAFITEENLKVLSEEDKKWLEDGMKSVEGDAETTADTIK